MDTSLTTITITPFCTGDGALYAKLSFDVSVKTVRKTASPVERIFAPPLRDSNENNVRYLGQHSSHGDDVNKLHGEIRDVETQIGGGRVV